MHPRIQMVEFKLPLMFQLFKCNSQGFNLVSNNTNWEGILACGIKEKSE